MVLHRFNAGLPLAATRIAFFSSLLWTTSQRLTIPRSTITSSIAGTPCHSAAWRLGRLDATWSLLDLSPCIVHDSSRWPRSTAAHQI